MSTNTVYFWPSLERAFAELHRVLRPGGRLALGFSSAQKMRSFDTITRHGFLLREADAIAAAAQAEGFEPRLVTLTEGDTDGDCVVVAQRN